jgi:hypothetical protein
MQQSVPVPATVSASLASTSSEWSSRTERYCRAWSDELKVSEFKHWKACEWYQYFHNIVGGIGQITTIAAFLTTFGGLFANGGQVDNSDDAGGCNSICFGFRVTSIVVSLVASVATAFLTFYGAQSNSEKNKAAASEYNALWRRIDIMLLRPRQMRESFWDFITPLKEDYERILASAPTTRAESRSKRAAERIVIGIGSILSSNRRQTMPSSSSSHKSSSGAHASAPASAPTSAPASAPQQQQPLSAASLESLVVHSSDDDDDDPVLRESETRTARKFEKIRRTTTSRRLEAGTETAAAASAAATQPRWFYKKRLQHGGGSNGTGAAAATDDEAE